MKQSDPAQTFLLEAEDLLAEIEETAIDLSQNPGDPEAVNRMFRAFHTIKGSGAMFGFDEVAAFTHHVETLLDGVRKGALEITPPLLSLLLAARDHIKTLLLEPGTPGAPEAGASLVAQISACAAGGARDKDTPPPAPQVAAQAPAAGA